MEGLVLIIPLALLIAIALGAHFIARAVYRYFIRAGHANPIVMRVFAFLASFVVICLIVGVAGSILLSTFRFGR
jgi:hypothetical protein